jgi:hypothetical protein
MANKKTNSKLVDTNTYIDMLYMTPEEVTAKDIKTLLENESSLDFELWEEMNVLELILPNKSSIDFDPLEVNFKDPSDASFVKNRRIKTIFAINIAEADLPTVIPYFEQIVNKFTGFLCADTEDFNPVYVGTSKM